MVFPSMGDWANGGSVNERTREGAPVEAAASNTACPLPFRKAACTHASRASRRIQLGFGKASARIREGSSSDSRTLPHRFEQDPAPIQPQWSPQSLMGMNPATIKRGPSNVGGSSSKRMRGSLVSFAIPASRAALSGHSTGFSFEAGSIWRPSAPPSRSDPSRPPLRRSTWERRTIREAPGVAHA